MDLLETLNELITALAGSPWVYLVVFAVCVIDGFFPPVPSETVVVASATLAAATGAPNLPLLIAVAAVGAAAGDNIAYWIGRGVGTTRFRWMRRRRVASTIAFARRGLERRGALLIFAARYIPVGRIAVNMTAGATRFPIRRFLPLSAAAAITWALYATVFGLVAGNWLHDQPLLAVLLAVVLAVGIGWVVDLGLRRSLARRVGGSAETPHRASVDTGPVPAGSR